MTATNKLVPLMDAVEVAEILGVTKNALAQMRMKGTSPKFVKVGGRVKYHPDDVAEYINTNKHTETAA